MEKALSSLCCKKATHDRCFQYNENSDVIFHEELCHFAFRRLSEKRKRKTKTSAIFAALR